jgi:hypothetical protein
VRKPVPFRFGSSALKLDAQADRIVTLPSGIRDRSELFELLRSRLPLPDYFGGNWDALSECLRDLSWLTQRRVALVHEELPRLPPSDLATYLSVLAECVADWKPGAEHELLVVFPRRARQTIT